MDSKQYVFISSHPADLSHFLQAVRNYNLVKDAECAVTSTYYDTFDWRLYQANLTLCKESYDYILKSLDTGEPVSTLCSRTKKAPRFSNDFPVSRLKDAITPVMDIRALLPMAVVKKVKHQFSVLNTDGAKIFAFETEKLSVVRDSKKNPAVVLAYCSSEHHELLDYFDKHIHSAGFRKVAGYKEIAAELFALSGKAPGSYSAKIELQLDPDLPSGKAMKLIFVRLLDIIKQNEKGVIQDLDSEFLHDFRVSIRKTRSAWSQAQGVFPKDITDMFKERFREIAKLTNTTRDTSVFLLNKDRYIELFPNTFKRDITAFFRYLSCLYKKEHEQIAAELASEAYTETIRLWQEFLASEDENAEQSRNADTPILILAQKIILKRFKKVIKSIEKIGCDAPYPELHGLRIQCKKLRYLLEMLASLFPEKKIAFIVKHLKKLQDNLGALNDLVIQQQVITRYLDSIPAETDIPVKSVIAVGGLQSLQYVRQNELHKKSYALLQEFNSAKIRDMFYSMCSDNHADG
ncbi:MAG: CHAD domain-containing protein [Candidatus Auribacter fodinae]|jgi:CHAD domain-containing protein|uniref:CHAD domain-containing protein n=1 Tax=Candidatus Auribacter fodinae TaxID=2093366 RepID=A0A3A4R910_9BACT|nr:MAG: CHAD domain-containing protein [Candidatus Auribacter fodinae]